MLITIAMSAACMADTEPQPAIAAVEQPATTEIQAGIRDIEAAGSPDIAAAQQEMIRMIAHFHGVSEVEAFREQLLQEKAAEVAAALKVQAEREAAAQAIAAAEAQIDSLALEAQIERAEAAKAK